MTDLPDTMPAPPVPSINPTAVERKLMEYVLFPDATHSTAIGLHIEEGVAVRVTPRMLPATAAKWIEQVRSAVTLGTMFPEFCVKNHLKETVGVCGQCLAGRA